MQTTLDQATIIKYTEARFWTGELITDHLDDSVTRNPHGVAIVDSRRQVTWAELKELTDRAASALLELGVESGDVVSIQLPNWIEFMISHLAASRIGAVSNPLVPPYRRHELVFMLGLTRAKVAIIPGNFKGHDYPRMYADMRISLPALGNVIVVDGDQSDSRHGQITWDELLSRAPTPDQTSLAARKPAADDVTLVIYTSGTTGEPKGVMHTHNTLMAANQSLPNRLGLDSSAVLHSASTLGHLTGLLYCSRLALQMGGAKSVLQDTWNPDSFSDLVEQHHISFTAGATPFLHDTVEVAMTGRRDLSSLVRFCCMGAPIPRHLLRRAKIALPQMITVGGWGQTENSMVTVSGLDTPDDKIADRDGYALPGMQVRVVDTNDKPLPPGAEGRIQVTGPFLFVGYLERLNETRRLYHGEWFDTGDNATLDDAGYLSITGRTKDIIVRGGENLPVAYIENILHEDPRIRVATVVGIPDERLGERACAVVIPAEGVENLTMDSLRDYLRAKGVAKNYWPESLVLAEFLPRTASGKIQKFQVRQLLSTGALSTTDDSAAPAAPEHG